MKDENDKKIVYFISAKDCEECKRMKFLLLKLSDNLDSYMLKEVDSEDDEAIALGVKYNLSDLPACIIEDNVFYGKQYKEITEALEKLWKMVQKKRQ